MKLNGIFGKGSGKVGESVWAVSGGVQIVRPYNPNVTNPRTDAQVQQRAKFKLLSQLAAALAPAIAFKKKGLVSARNLFVSANIGKCRWQNDKAVVALAALDLTGSIKYLPGIVLGAHDAQSAALSLSSAATDDIKAVVYVMCEYVDGDHIRMVDVNVVSEAGAGRTFPGSTKGVEETGVVYAYGITDTTSARGISLADYQTTEEGVSANVAAIEKAIASGAGFTMTVATDVSNA